jgi:hypothetical protein
MCIALPLLPLGRIEEAFQTIQQYAQAVNEVPNVQVRLSVARFLDTSELSGWIVLVPDVSLSTIK